MSTYTFFNQYIRSTFSCMYLFSIFFILPWPTFLAKIHRKIQQQQQQQHYSIRLFTTIRSPYSIRLFTTFRSPYSIRLFTTKSTITSFILNLLTSLNLVNKKQQIRLHRKQHIRLHRKQQIRLHKKTTNQVA